MKKPTIEIDLPEELIFKVMYEAHKEDITTNKLFERILKKYIEKIKSEEGKDNAK